MSRNEKVEGAGRSSRRTTQGDNSEKRLEHANLWVLLLNGIVAAVVAALITGGFAFMQQDSEHREADRRAKVEVYFATIDAAVQLGEARDSSGTDGGEYKKALADWDSAFWKSFAYSTVMENDGVLDGLSTLKKSVESSSDRTSINRAVATFTISLCKAVSPGKSCPPYSVG